MFIELLDLWSALIDHGYEAYYTALSFDFSMEIQN